MKVVRLIKTCLNKTYSKVCIVKNLPEWSDTKGCYIAIAFHPLEYAVRKVQENHEVLELSGMHQLLVAADVINTLGKNTNNIKEYMETLLQASGEVCLEVITEKTKYMVTSLSLPESRTVSQFTDC